MKWLGQFCRSRLGSVTTLVLSLLPGYVMVAGSVWLGPLLFDDEQVRALATLPAPMLTLAVYLVSYTKYGVPDRAMLRAIIKRSGGYFMTFETDDERLAWAEENLNGFWLYYQYDLPGGHTDIGEPSHFTEFMFGSASDAVHFKLRWMA